MKPLFLDSSVIIDHLRGQITAEVQLLRRLLGSREMVIGDLVLMEVLQGLRDPRLLRATEQVLATFRCVDLGGLRRVRQGALIYRLLRAAGVTPRSTIDVLIATFCVEEGLDLLASDRDYILMAPHIGLTLATPSLS